MPVSDNRDRFNGKEDQVFIGDCLADYGARCYNKLNGRWLSQDPLAEKYFNITQYGFCVNNPMNYIDLWGLDVWTTSDPGRNQANYGRNDEYGKHQYLWDGTLY